ncbi:hypothetical protein [Pseudodonghicola xiamenensis]|uniref:Type IV pilus biogenesis n=1 Tax=Pseudodonghicola xiamenensis TaxID=337702 RepID=A0A8J3H4E7_9RHOB|nr:hypothetical protein [Pseudodonghicola xiamenensis]GHG79444.1 hypothetical protein GCM10010961_01500 [Pseudodonghicola xiamenensis]
MTDMSRAPGDTPAKVAQLATTPQALNERDLSLIGLTGGSAGFRALLRLPGGRIKSVEPGSRLSQGQVVAIDSDGLILQRNGKTRRIGFPGG